MDKNRKLINSRCMRMCNKLFKIFFQALMGQFLHSKFFLRYSGQTGAGKTYTIVGNCPEAPESGLEFRPYLIDEKRGIMVRAMEEIITISRKRKDSRITISFFEIYNEKIFDLLTNNPKPMEIREGKNG